jgi:cytochrome P450
MQSGTATQTETKGPSAPGPRGVKAFMAYFAMRRDRIAFVTQMVRKHGDVCCLSVGGRSLLLIASLEAAEHILLRQPELFDKGPGIAEAREYFGSGLLTSEGTAWQKQRRSIHKFFHTIGPDRIIEAVDAGTEALTERWHKAVLPVDVVPGIASLVIAVLGRLLVGADLDAERIRTDLQCIERYAMQATVAMRPGQTMPRSVRRAMGSLDAQAQALADLGTSPYGSAFLSKALREGSPTFSRSEIVDQVRTFFLAGQDNVVTSLLWVVLMLARFPEMQNRLRQEVLDIAGMSAIEPDSLRKMVQIRAFLFETLRLYPPVWAITRCTKQQVYIAGYDVAKGSDIVILPYVINRNPRLWSAPDTFDPGRFLNEDRSFGRLLTPFGMGPRKCVAASFALVELTVAVALLVRKFTFTTGTNRLPRVFPGFSFHPVGRVEVNVLHCRSC